MMYESTVLPRIGGRRADEREFHLWRDKEVQLVLGEDLAGFRDIVDQDHISGTLSVMDSSPDLLEG